MVYKKLKKTTTQKQFGIMVDYLQEHPELVGFVPGAGDVSTDRRQLWDRLTEILNQHGPPTRRCVEWKSIWSDYKYNIKRKLCSDLKFAKGKHPVKRHLFSSIEGKVISMLKLKEKLCSKHYKINTKPIRTDKGKGKIAWCKGNTTTAHSKQEPALSEEDNEESIVICSDFETLEEKSEFVDVFSSTEVHKPLTSDEILFTEQDNTETVECDVTLLLKDTLQGMQKTQLEILKELKEYNRQKKDTHYFKEQQLHLEREKFEEQKRQNLEANKRASVELDLKRRELELYEIKLKGSCADCVVKTENVEFVVSNF